MSKNKLFEEDSDEEVSFKTENEYAKKYDAWREKEEMHKLEQKYGSKALDGNASATSDSEDESDEQLEVNEETEKQFLKTLALLKTKDPRIYDTNYTFFDDEVKKETEKETKTKTLTFADSDDDDDENDGNIFSIEKKCEVNVENNGEDDNRKNQKGGKLKDYLIGKAKHIDDEAEKDLEPLKALWSDPKLNDGEAFLRDYILNKKYLDDGDIGDAAEQMRDDEDLEADEKMVEEQGKFERAYNFRFEEPDEEYLKRFPRTMNYIRPKDDRRARKRAEVRTRKEEEKNKKMEEIARLKALKLKEIQEKIARIKEVTGNEDLAFEEQDIEGDFDPEEHDRRMRALFDEEYYGEADTEKPRFPDLDEELEIENWDKYETDNQDVQKHGDAVPHCEDDDFNMDADYDPKQARANLLEEIQQSLVKKRRNRKRKSKLHHLLNVEKPKFIPTTAEKTYAEYMDEYYKMDCEDVIGGDLPTRFKYREVVPNDYGLTIEEILLADDKELTQWVPLKKIVKHRPENVERGEVKTYAQRAQDHRLKKKMLPSLFQDLPEELEIVVPVQEGTKKKKKKKGKNKDISLEESQQDDKTNDVNVSNSDRGANDNESENDNNPNTSNSDKHSKKKKKRKEKIAEETGKELVENNDVEKINDFSHSNQNLTDVSDKLHNGNNKRKKKNKKRSNSFNDSTHTETMNSNEKVKSKKKRKDGFIVESITNVEPSQVSNGKILDTPRKNDIKNEGGTLKRKLDSNTNNQVPNKKKKKKNKQTELPNKDTLKKEFNNKNSKKNKFKNEQTQNKSPQNPLGKLSDERLKAYGLNPKKYRSFLKYKKF